MSRDGITIELRGEGTVLSALHALTDKGQALQQVFDEIGEDFRARVDLGFRDGLDPYGRPWAPLSDTTMERRRGTSAQILVDTRNLSNSWTYEAGPLSLRLGTTVEYAGTQQFGAKKGAFGKTRHGAPIPWGDIPARMMLPTDGLPPEWEQSALDIVRSYLRTS